MHHAMDSRIPIFMLAQQFAKDQNYQLIKTTQLFFQPTSQGYQKISPTILDPETPVIVIIGSTCRDFSLLPDLNNWTKELTEHCPIDLVLAYAAAHRQYPDESKDQLLKEIVDSNYEYHKSKAQEWGCTLENPSGFFLNHAFCETIKNISNRFSSLATIS